VTVHGDRSADGEDVRGLLDGDGEPQRIRGALHVIPGDAHRLVGINAAALDPSRVVDATHHAQLTERIEACLGPGDSDREPWAETVRGFLRQTFELVPDILAHVTGQEKAFTRLSGGLV
jgi:hypothetical protein